MKKELFYMLPKAVWPMQFLMKRDAWKKHKIFKAIINSNVINMVYNFFRIKKSSKMLLHYKPMFFNVTIPIAMRMVRRITLNISLMFQSSFKKGVISTFFKGCLGRFHFPFCPCMPRDVSFLKRLRVFNKLAFHRLPITLSRAIFSYSQKTRFDIEGFFANFTFYRVSFFHALIITCIFLFVSPAYCENNWRGDGDDQTILGTTNISDIDTESYNEIVYPLDLILRNFREGVKLKYNSASSVTVTSGSIVCQNSGSTGHKMKTNTSNINSVWTVGTNGLDAGSESSSTTYYVYSICDAAADTFTINLSTSSSAPSGATYYRKLGSFTNNSSSNITAVTNDDDTVVVSTGTVSNGGTISVPSGWAADECDWTVGLGSGAVSGSAPDGIYYTVTVNSSRVATCTKTSINAGGSPSGAITCNYIIACHR